MQRTGFRVRVSERIGPSRACDTLEAGKSSVLFGSRGNCFAVYAIGKRLKFQSPIFKQHDERACAYSGLSSKHSPFATFEPSWSQESRLGAEVPFSSYERNFWAQFKYMPPKNFLSAFIMFTYSLTARVVGAPQMTSQSVCSISEYKLLLRLTLLSSSIRHATISPVCYIW